MKKAYIIHGWGGNPEEPMHKWIKSSLEKEGYIVVAPEMPNPDVPKIKSWLNKIRKIVNNLNEDTLFIGHSIGCQAVLRYVETLEDKKVGKIILIAPWMHLDEETIKEEGEESANIAKPWVETPIDWFKVKKNSREIIAFFSDDDPFVPVSEENLFKKNLDAKTLILNKRGHFDPSSGIKDLPEIMNYLK